MLPCTRPRDATGREGMILFDRLLRGAAMTVSIGRREFVTALGSAAAWPVAARGQQAPVPTIGYLGIDRSDLVSDRLRAFRQGLSETGYVEGRNLTIEYRWAEGEYDR